MAPNYMDITYFLEVAETLNISRAAERLGLTQPSLSSAIRRLEDCLGVELFLRNRTGVQLTRAGRVFAEKSRDIQHQWGQLKNDILQEDQEVTGQYVIGAHVSVAKYTFPVCLPELLKGNRALELKLVHDLSRKITEGVVSFKIDFGIVVNPVQHPDLVISELCKDEVTLWVKNASSVGKKGRFEIETLLCDPQLLQVQTLQKTLLKKKIHWNRVVSSKSLEVVADLTASGVGVGILPTRIAKRAGLKAYPDAPVFKDSVCLVYRADRVRSKATKTIAAAIRKNFK